MHLTLTLLVWIFRGIFGLFNTISILYSSGIYIVWISLHTHTVYKYIGIPLKTIWKLQLLMYYTKVTLIDYTLWTRKYNTQLTMLLSTLMSALFIVFFGKSHTLLSVTAIATHCCERSYCWISCDYSECAHKNVLKYLE
jgi:hypothetical protein